MANDQQLERLKQGVEGWNDWRAQNPEEAIDLSEADLRGLKLQKANLKGADLHQAKLQFSNLSGADLDGANLDRAKFQEANLYGAQISNAVLQNCNFMEANLQGTNLENSKLVSSQFNEDVMFDKANLKGADLTDASGLSVPQIQSAQVNENTKLPEYLSDDMEDEDFLNSML